MICIIIIKCKWSPKEHRHTCCTDLLCSHMLPCLIGLYLQSTSSKMTSYIRQSRWRQQCIKSSVQNPSEHGVLCDCINCMPSKQTLKRIDPSTALHVFCHHPGPHPCPGHTLVRLLASGLPLLTLFHPPGAGVTFLKGPSFSLLPPLALLSIHQGYGLPLGVSLATWQNTPL